MKKYLALILLGLIFLLSGINHGDLNDHNILIESRESAFGDAVYQVSGVLDFEVVFFCFVFAITQSSMDQRES